MQRFKENAEISARYNNACLYAKICSKWVYLDSIHFCICSWL